MANMYITYIQRAVLMRAEVTADNTSIRVLWEWSHQDLLMCFESVRVDYQPEGGSLMMRTMDQLEILGNQIQTRTGPTRIPISTSNATIASKDGLACEMHVFNMQCSMSEPHPFVALKWQRVETLQNHS